MWYLDWLLNQVDILVIKMMLVKTKIRELQAHSPVFRLASDFEKIKEVSIATEKIFQEAYDAKKITLIIEDILEYTNEWLILHSNFMDGSKVSFLPFLSECACINNDNFNRFKNNRRLTIQASILQSLTQQFPDIEAPMHYLSLGSGGLLQDFIIVASMIKAGYKNIHVSLVDPELIVSQSGDNVVVHPACGQFCMLVLYATEKNVEMTVEPFKSIKKYSEANISSPNLITAIDFDDLQSQFSDVMLAHSLLAENGCMFLSVTTADYVLAKNSCLNFTIQHKIPDQYLKEFQHKNTQLNITSLMRTSTFFDVFSTMLLPYIEQLPHLNMLCLTLINPEKTSIIKNKSFTQKNLTQFIRLMLPSHIQLLTEFVDEKPEFDKLLSILKNKDQQHLVLCMQKSWNDGEQQALNDLKMIHQAFSQASLIADVRVYQKMLNRNMLEPIFMGAWVYQPNRNELRTEIRVAKHDSRLRDWYSQIFPDRQFTSQPINQNSEVVSAAASAAAPAMPLELEGAAPTAKHANTRKL